MNDDKQTADEERVYQVAAWLAKKDGVEEDDLHRLIWEGNPPEPWGEVWNRYEDDARELLAMLAASPAHTESAAPVDTPNLVTCARMGHGVVSMAEVFSPEIGEPGITWMELAERRPAGLDTGDVYPEGSRAQNVLAYVSFANPEAINQTIATLQRLKAKHFPDDPAPSPVSGADERAAFGEWKKGWWFADGGHSDTEVCSYADTDSAAESAFMAGWEASRAALAPTPTGQHSDDAAVDRFCAAMKAKLAQARDKGRGGWEQCDPVELSNMLREHVEKGDPLDVANFCMFLWALRKPISTARAAIPADCDVRRILLRVVPGDGDGLEEYARNVNDVERVLSEMGEKLENLEGAPTGQQALSTKDS